MYLFLQPAKLVDGVAYEPSTYTLQKARDASNPSSSDEV
jgi:hypothetical protein